MVDVVICIVLYAIREIGLLISVLWVLVKFNCICKELIWELKHCSRKYIAITILNAYNIYIYIYKLSLIYIATCIMLRCSCIFRFSHLKIFVRLFSE